MIKQLINVMTWYTEESKSGEIQMKFRLLEKVKRLILKE